MNLTYIQTLNLIYEKKKLNYNSTKYKFTTKTKIRCLCCGCTMFISYKQFGINAIFCKVCYPSKINYPTIVQYNYARVIKEKQLSLIENQLKIKI